jgi:hypothetical protein
VSILVSTFELFIAIAEIAGIFIGFGALISITRKDEIDPAQLQRIRGVVSVGLAVIVVSLVPIGLNTYGIIDHQLWFISSFAYLTINWGMIVTSFRSEQNRRMLSEQMKFNTLTTIFFWVLLEIPLQAPLILILIGIFQSLDPALYTTSLLFNLFQAVYVLAQIVYSQADPPKISSSSGTKKRIIPH